MLCSLPVLAAAAVAAAIEESARAFYIEHLTWMDRLILALGAGLFGFQTILSWRALTWRGTNFDERPDKWLTNLSHAAEWFPLLGLLGTVAAIMKTFSGIQVNSAAEVIKNYAPAMTATGSGLFMALINIFPTWMVPIGRDLIRTLGGEDAPAQPQSATTVAAPTRSDPGRAPRQQTSADAGS
jgi:hypothetical protein